MASTLGRLFVEILGDNTGLNKSLVNSEKQLRKFNKETSLISKDLTKLGKDLSIFFTLPLTALGIQGVKTAGNLEQLQTTFETMLKNEDKAIKLTKELESFSAKTPMKMMNLAENIQELLAYGINVDEIFVKLTNLGNAAGGNQEKLDRLALAYGKVKAKGKATLEELNLFTEAGVPILQALSDQYGVTTETMLKFIEAGKIGFKDVDQALTNLTTGSGQFAGLMEKQSTKLNGQISTMLDNLSLDLMEFAEIFIPTIKEIISNISSFADFVRGLDTETKKTIATFALLAAGAGPAIFVFGKLSTVFSGLVGLIFKLSQINLTGLLMSNQLLLAAAGITAVSIAIGTWYKNTHDINVVNERLSGSIERLKKNSEDYKRVLNDLKTGTNNLTQAEKDNLEIKKAQLRLQLQESLEKGIKAYENLNKRLLFSDKSLLESQKKLREENAGYIEHWRSELAKAEKAYNDNKNKENQRVLKQTAELLQYSINTYTKLDAQIKTSEGGVEEFINLLARNRREGIIDDVYLSQLKQIPGLYDKVIAKIQEMAKESKKTKPDAGTARVTSPIDAPILPDYTKLLLKYKEYIDLKQKYNYEDGLVSEAEFKARLKMQEIEQTEGFNLIKELAENTNDLSKKSLDELETMYQEYTAVKKRLNENDFASFTDYQKAREELEKLTSDKAFHEYLNYQEQKKAVDKKTYHELSLNFEKYIIKTSSFLDSNTNSVISSINTLFQGVGDGFTSMWNSLSNATEGFTKGFKTDLEGIKTIANVMVNIFENIGNTVTNIFNTVNAENKRLLDEKLSLLDAQHEQELKELDDRLQAELKSKGLARQTDLEQAQSTLEELKKQRQEETDSEKQAEIDKNINKQEQDIERLEIEKRYAEEKSAMEQRQAEERYNMEKATFETNKETQIGMVWIMYAIGSIAALAMGISQLGPILGTVVGGLTSAALFASALFSSILISKQKFPPMKKLAKGGWADSPAIAEFGEGPDTEAVLPLNSYIFDRIAEGIFNALFNRISRNSSNTYYSTSESNSNFDNKRVVNINGPTYVTANNTDDYLESQFQYHKESFRR